MPSTSSFRGNPGEPAAPGNQNKGNDKVAVPFLGHFQLRRLADRHGPRRLTAIDVGDAEIRLLSVERNGDNLHFPSGKILPYVATDDLAQSPLFQEAIQEAAKFSPYLSIIYGGESTLVRLMNFPTQSTREDNLAAQVRRTLGVGSDYTVLCRTVRQTEAQYTVLAAAMPEAAIDKLRRVVEQRALRPVSLVHRGIAIANLTEKARGATSESANIGMLYADSLSSLLVLDVAGETVLIRQLKEGLSSVYESVMQDFGLDHDTAVKLFNSGSFDVSAQKSAALSGWMHQIELSLDFIERRTGSRIGKLYLCGSCLGLNILRTIFEVGLKRLVEVLPPLPGFDCPLLEGRLAEGQRPVSPHLLAACEAARVTLWEHANHA